MGCNKGSWDQGLSKFMGRDPEPYSPNPLGVYITKLETLTSINPKLLNPKP